MALRRTAGRGRRETYRRPQARSWLRRERRPGAGPGMRSLSRWPVTTKEGFALPLGARRRIGHSLHQLHDEGVEFRGGGFIDRLIEVVGRRVIALGKPALLNGGFGRTFFSAEIEHEGR